MEATTDSVFRPATIEDVAQIDDMCRNNWGGNDPAASNLPNWIKDPNSFPHVLAQGSRVIALGNAKKLQPDDGSVWGQVIYINGIRVVESERRRGVGTRISMELVNKFMGVPHCSKPVRIISTTAPGSCMESIFRKLGLSLQHRYEIWPSLHAKRQARKVGGPLLEALGLEQFIPEHARKCIQLWEQVTESDHIVQAMRTLQAYGGSYLQPLFGHIDTVAGAANYLRHELQKGEKRAVWKLERPHKPPVLLFSSTKVSSDCKEEKEGRYSACTADIEGAECAVAFAAVTQEVKLFSVAFDSTITVDNLKTSPLLSACCPTFSVVVYSN